MLDFSVGLIKCLLERRMQRRVGTVAIAPGVDLADDIGVDRLV